MVFMILVTNLVLSSPFKILGSEHENADEGTADLFETPDGALAG